MVKRYLIILGCICQLVLASYMVFDDTGTKYLTVGDDGQSIYLWQVNGLKSATAFPFMLPEKAVLSREPFFKDIDADGVLDIVCTYTLNTKLYEQVIRQTGDSFDDKIYPKEISDNAVVEVVTINPIIDENLVSLDGRAVYNTKYRYYQGAFKHTLYDAQGPSAVVLTDIYSKAPTTTVTLNTLDTDFDRYLVFARENTQQRFDLFWRSTTQNIELTLSLNYVEGIYPWQFLALDYFNNVTRQDINYYYDHTPPTFDSPSQSFTYYFSPNADKVQDLLTISVVPSDNLYYKQSIIMDIFDGPTYIVSTRTDGLTFATLNCVWNGAGSDGNIVKDATYNAQLYVVDGCGNQSIIVTGQIIVDTVPPQIWAQQQNSPYFTPNGDGDLDLLTVTVSLSEPAQVTMNIYNSFGRLVRVISETGDITTTQNLVWDGIDNDGIIESGDYRYNLVLMDRAGNTTMSPWYAVQLEYHSPIIAQVGPEKDAFNFTREDFRLNLDLLESAHAQCFIYDRNGNRVATMNSGVDVITGNNVLLWHNPTLADGVYMYRLLVKSNFGITGAVTGVFFNDTVTPTATFPGLQKAYAAGTVSFTIALSEPATATLNVFGQTIIMSVTLNSEVSCNVLTTGTYVLTLNVSDQAANNCVITRSIEIGHTTTVSESLAPTYTAVEAAIGAAVRTLHKPEPQYFNTERAVRYVVNADEFIKGISLLSLTPKTIGQFSAMVYDVSRNLITSITSNVDIPAGAQIITWNALGLTTGVYTIEASLARSGGISTVSATVVYDTVSPSLTDLRVLSGKGLISTSRRIDLYLAATDNLLPVTEMRFSSNGVTWSIPEAFANSKYGFATVTADGLQEVWAQVKDAAGNWSLPVSFAIVVDASPPVHRTIRVNGEDGGGASTINVDLQFIADDAHGVTTMKISYNDAYSWIEYPYGTTLHYTLDPTAGLKHFFIKYTDSLGLESGIIEDVVSLDKEPPTLVTINRLSAYWTNTQNVSLQLSAVDSFMGVARIVLSNDGFATATTFNYTPTTTLNVTMNWAIPATEVTHDIVAVFYDQAGNRSTQVTASCVYDITPPVIITQSVAIDDIYLPTIRPPVRIAVTGNEPVLVSVNVRRAGVSIFNSPLTPLLEREGSNAVSFNWTGEDSTNHYIQYGSVCDVTYQVVDLAGNIGASGSTRVTLNCGYEIASANYDLTMPGIEATSKSISVEYEDESGFSKTISGVLVNDKPRRGSASADLGQRKFRSTYWVAWGICPNDAGACTAIGDWWLYLNGVQVFHTSYYGNDNSNSGASVVVSSGNLVMSEYADDFGGIFNSMQLLGKKISRVHSTTDNMLNFVKYTDIDRAAEAYIALSPSGNMGTVGNISNNYQVFCTSSTNISVSRNGQTISVVTVPSGSEVAEPAMYISKSQNPRYAYSPTEKVAMEDIHIVWQQKNTPTDNWRIYYAVVPFYFEGFPTDGQMSIMSIKNPRILANPGIDFKSPLNGDYTGTEPKVEVKIFDDTGVSASALWLRLNDSPTTYNLSAYYTALDATQGTLNFTIGTVGPTLHAGKNTIYVDVADVSGNISEGSVSVVVRSGLFIEKLLNYPNPFENETTITYMLTAEAREVKARVYDISGRLRREIYNLPTDMGYNEHAWDGKDNNGRELANDVYYLILMARDSDGDWQKARTKAVKLK